MDHDPHHLPAEARRGRASLSNRAGRYETHTRERADDGWGGAHDLDLLRTQVRREVPRSALTRNTSPDVPFDRSINPYRGCEHGCIYCFARPSHAWLGLSPGLDFETRIVARPGIGAVLERELSRRSYRVAPIALGTNTDPYQPIEGQERVMREVLEVLARFRHPLTIVTKGTLIERDLDLLGDMAAQGLVQVGISVTTLDRHLARSMEPRVPPPARRLQVVERLAAAGVPVRIMAAPVVPGLTCHELEAILRAGRDAGARWASMIPLRLPREVAPLFQEWLAEAHPDAAEKVMNRVRQFHGGRDYDPEFGRRMTGQGEHAALLLKRFHLVRKRLGMDGPVPELRRDLFAVPLARDGQLALF